MIENRTKEFLKSIFSRNTWLIIFLVMITLISFLVLAFDVALRPALFTLKQGDVSQQDIQAPYTLTYQSQILTRQAQAEAVQKVQPVYLIPDPAITRQQIERLLTTLSFINNVRNDKNSTPDQKFTDLATLEYLDVSPNLAEDLLDLNETQWLVIQEEAIRTLGDALRPSIREDQIDAARQNLPSLIGYSIPETQADVIVSLVSPFIVANSIYSEEQTRLAQEQAISTTAPVTRTYVAGEIIVRRGQILSETAIEALNQYGLIKPDDSSRNIVSALAISFSVFLIAALYLKFRAPHILWNSRAIILIGSLFLLFLVISRIIIPNRVVIPYLFPLAAFGLSIAGLFNFELGLILSSLLAILTSYGISNTTELTVFYIALNFSGMLALRKGYRIVHFLWASLIMTGIGTLIILAYRLPNAFTDWVGIGTLIGATFIHAISATVIALGVQSLFAQLLGQVTGLQLLELARPDHPLLRYLLQNAPGTYQHSLQVANLAEQAAEAIGADPLLTRVGAIYHDVGKSQNPSFFIENQVPGKIDTHDNLDPEYSAGKIIQHVLDGLSLGKKFRLPGRIISFMSEHHGTLLTRYQYSRALSRADNNPELVDKHKFRYPGPPPQSRETALLMLADGCEARARADFPENDDDLRALIKKAIDFYRSEGQLNEAPLTMRDLYLIEESFFRTLKNTYHPRIQYPELPKTNSSESKSE